MLRHFLTPHYCVNKREAISKNKSLSRYKI
jgi:hypothetical protein